MSGAGLSVLVVEDDADDRAMLAYAFRTAAPCLRVEYAHDGEEAERRLSRAGEPPGLVLLDGHLPCKSGLEVLGWIRSRPALKDVTVMMLTSSTESRDIDRAYALGANSYLVKTPDLDALCEIVRGIGQYALLLAARAPAPGAGAR